MTSILYIVTYENKGCLICCNFGCSRCVVEQLSSIAKHPFDGSRIQYVEKQFIEILDKSGASGLSKLFSQNDERSKAIIHDGQKHYRKFLALGRYLTLLGEISLKRGIYQSNKSNRSICPLEVKLKFINDYVSFAAAEYICYSRIYDP